MATAKGYEANLHHTRAIWPKALSCSTVAFILQQLHKDLAERLAGIHCRFTQPGTSILSSSTIGILDSLAE